MLFWSGHYEDFIVLILKTSRIIDDQIILLINQNKINIFPYYHNYCFSFRIQHYQKRKKV